MSETCEPDSHFKSQFPLHYAVWNNDYTELQRLLENDSNDVEQIDPRGRTPLMLAVTLGHLECVRLLLRHGASVTVENRDGWTVVQEATATGDPELLSTILESRDMQRFSSRVLGIPSLLVKLSEAPDFYVEMKWEFTSWVPLVSRMCPSDTYRVFKRGSNVRIDTTLLGFDQTQWQRGSRSYIFKCNGGGATMLEVDHDAKQVYVETIEAVDQNELSSQMKPHPAVITHRLRTPIVTTYIDTDKISFERDKKGIWGWRNDRSEVINGHDCKVFSASNVELVTKTRTEHLTEVDKQQNSSPISPIQSFLNIAEVEEKHSSTDTSNGEELKGSINNPTSITAEEYFDSSVNLGDRDIGRPKETTSKIQKFKGHLWLAESYPLKLQEQVMPIVDLMAISSSHFAKLKDFIQMQLPSGFPVKIEIPLFHVLTARITFGNIFGLDEAVEKVSTIEEDERLSCIIEDSVFEAPTSYAIIGGACDAGGHRQMGLDEDDALLQYALQQSLLESSGGGQNEDQIDIWEALQSSQRTASGNSSNFNVSSSPSLQSTPNHVPISSLEETQLQRAIEESLAMSQQCVLTSLSGTDENRMSSSSSPPLDSDMALALSLSQKQQEEEDRQRKQEEEMLKKVLELSLKDK